MTEEHLEPAEWVYRVSKGDPGAMSVCLEVMRKAELIDPSDVFGKLGKFMDFDTLEIYEHRIWTLYDGVCGRHLGKMIAILRANQLGFISKELLNHAIDNHGDGIDVDALVAAVQKRLPDFRLEPE